MTWERILCAALGVLALAAAGETSFTQPLKLRGVKSEKPVFYLDDGKKDAKASPVRPFGRAWSPVLISRDGAAVRVKKDMKQFLIGNLPLQKKSFSFSVWASSDSINAPFSMVVANTTRPPCWGIRLFSVEPAGSFKAEVYYNWGIKGIPGNLLRAPENLQIGKWHFFALTFDREKELLSFYLDGELAGTAKMPKETAAFRDSFSVSQNPWFFDGQLYDLTFYPTVLTADQIAAQFKAGSAVLKEEK